MTVVIHNHNNVHVELHTYKRESLANVINNTSVRAYNVRVSRCKSLILWTFKNGKHRYFQIKRSVPAPFQIGLQH